MNMWRNNDWNSLKPAFVTVKSRTSFRSEVFNYAIRIRTFERQMSIYFYFTVELNADKVRVSGITVITYNMKTKS